MLPKTYQLADPEPKPSLQLLTEALSLWPWSPTPVTPPPKRGLLSEGTSTSVNSDVPQSGRRQAGRRCRDAGPLPSTLCSPSSPSLTSERAAARPGQGVGEGGGARALSRAWGVGPSLVGRNVWGRGRAGGGRGRGGCWLLFCQVPGTGLKKHVPHAI